LIDIEKLKRIIVRFVSFKKLKGNAIKNRENAAILKLAH